MFANLAHVPRGLNVSIVTLTTILLKSPIPLTLMLRALQKVTPYRADKLHIEHSGHQDYSVSKISSIT